VSANNCLPAREDKLRHNYVCCYFVSHTHTHTYKHIQTHTNTHTINFLPSITTCVIHVVSWSLGLGSQQIYALLKSVGATNISQDSVLTLFCRDLFEANIYSQSKKKLLAFYTAPNGHYRVLKIPAQHSILRPLNPPKSKNPLSFSFSFSTTLSSISRLPSWHKGKNR